MVIQLEKDVKFFSWANEGTEGLKIDVKEGIL